MGNNKNKVKYVDDGRTLADMSNVSTRRLPKRDKATPRSPAKDIWSTYWNAVRMMLVPTLVMLCALGVVYMIVYFLFTVM